MKNKLIKLINQAIELLKQCGYHDKSAWMQNKLNIVMHEDITSESFRTTISEIKNIMGGMGSFSDLPMIPEPDSGISPEDARQLQWDLSEDIYEAISFLLYENS